MAQGPGKYDDLCTVVRETADADGVLLFVANGKHGNGFSVQATSFELIASLPALLESMAESIREDQASGDNARPMSDFHTVAFTLLTLGKAAGLLSQTDIRDRLLEGMQKGSLNPDYLIVLRDRLNDLLTRAGEEAKQ